MYYFSKIIVSGSIIEVYQYDKIQKKDYTRKKKLIIPGQLQLDLNKKIKEKRMDSVNRTRTVIRRLINANPELDEFVTLTFKENITDITIANRHFSKFIMRLKYKHPNLKYVAVIEFQRRGAVHYHLLMNISYVKNIEIAQLWGHGFVKVNKIDHVDNVGAYICKYLSKDTIDTRMWNKKKFFCSKNLATPLAFFSESEIANIKNAYDLGSVQPVYKCEFDNEYTGKVKYTQYNLKRYTDTLKKYITT